MSQLRSSALTLAAPSKVAHAAAPQGSPAPKCVLDATIASTSARARALAKKAGRGVETIQVIDGGMDGQDIRFLSGVPAGTKLVSADSIPVARHYSPATDAIRHSGSLRAGPRPYIFPLAHVRDEYRELTGIFFTVPEHNPAELWMGLNESSPYVDFILPAGIGILEIEKGVYLIPGPPRVQPWIRQAYRQWQKTGKAPVGMEARFRQYDATGGIPEPLELPIDIGKVQGSELQGSRGPDTARLDVIA